MLWRLLKRGTENSTAQVRRRLAKSTLEAVGPRREVSVLGNDANLIFVVGNDLSQFLLNVLRLLGLSTDTRQDSGSFIKLSLDDEISGGLWEDEETSSKDDSRDQLDGNRDSVGAAVEAILGGVVDAGCDHQAEGDGKLVTCNDCATNLAGCDLGHVENDDGRDETNT